MMKYQVARAWIKSLEQFVSIKSVELDDRCQITSINSCYPIQDVVFKKGFYDDYLQMTIYEGDVFERSYIKYGVSFLQRYVVTLKGDSWQVSEVSPIPDVFCEGAFITPRSYKIGNIAQMSHLERGLQSWEYVGLSAEELEEYKRLEGILLAEGAESEDFSCADFGSMARPCVFLSDEELIGIQPDSSSIQYIVKTHQRFFCVTQTSIPFSEDEYKVFEVQLVDDKWERK